MRKYTAIFLLRVPLSPFGIIHSSNLKLYIINRHRVKVTAAARGKHWPGTNRLLLDVKTLFFLSQYSKHGRPLPHSCPLVTVAACVRLLRLSCRLWRFRLCRRVDFPKGNGVGMVWETRWRQQRMCRRTFMDIKTV